MFSTKKLIGFYCITPVHMGADKGLGLIDSPIQREIHTSFPMFAGSGIKGALRHQIGQDEKNKDEIEGIFGPDSDGSAHAGAVSFTDASLVAFPIRSNNAPYLYVCSPLTISKALRHARTVDPNSAKNIKEPQLNKGKFLASNFDKVKSKSPDTIVLEDITFKKQTDDPAIQPSVERFQQSVERFAEWLSNFFQGSEGPLKEFGRRIKEHLVVIPDHEFTYFVRKSTTVEPHVRIDSKTGTAVDGALFYIETLPPESILMGMMLSSIERRPSENKSSEAVCDWVSKKIDQQVIQFGGDATTGRGLSYISIRGKNESL